MLKCILEHEGGAAPPETRFLVRIPWQSAPAMSEIEWAKRD
jgi:hypothetical protein